ncbi:MAG: hypothetical protein EPO68_06145 [Planctomycetota bacterium]|nr:MAG: hypothetical protein EPO68_06145 [Planctomycetota bacterium]
MLDWYNLFRTKELEARFEQANRARMHRSAATSRQQQETDARVELLEEELARHALLIRVLIRLLMDRGIATQQQFEAALQAVDLEDGVADGKVTAPKPAAPAPKPVDMEALRRKHGLPKRRGD